MEGTLHPKRILIVEDDPSMSALLKKVIHQVVPSAEIFWAISLEQAFSKLMENCDISDQHPYELIIADIFLKGIGTGLDLWRVMCATFPQIPLLVISSLSLENVVAAVGEDEKKNLIFLKKPFTAQECEQKIRNILLRTAQLSPMEVKAMSEKPLLGDENKHLQLAHLLMLKLSADWLEKQQWLEEPYGGQNQVQDLLFQARLAANRLWELFFSKKKNKLNLDVEKIRAQIQQMSELTPELKDFLQERLNTVEHSFHH